jgi:hypothetical protein
MTKINIRDIFPRDSYPTKQSVKEELPSWSFYAIKELLYKVSKKPYKLTKNQCIDRIVDLVDEYG